MNELTRTRHTDIPILHGKVTAVSEVLKLKLGSFIFVEIVDSSRNKQCIVVNNDIVKIHNSIQLFNCFCVFKTAKKFQWKDKSSNGENADIYFMVNKMEHFSCTNSRLCDHCSFEIPILHHFDFFSIGAKAELITDMFSRQEINIQGKIQKMCVQDACIQLELQNVNSTCTMVNLLFIYCPHYKLLDGLVERGVRLGQVIYAYNVFPVYLWGSLRGFACTIRSSIDIGNIPLAIQTLDTSKSLPVFNTPIKIAKESRACCVMYTVWRVETLRRLNDACVWDRNNDVFIYNRILFLVRDVLENACTSSVSGSIKDVLSLPRQCIQEEFRDPMNARLMQIYAMHDKDWISSQLPEVWTCRRLRRIAETFVRLKIEQTAGMVHSKHVFETHCVNVQKSSGDVNIGHRIVDSDDVFAAVLVGSVISVDLSSVYREEDMTVQFRVMDRAGCIVLVIARTVSREFHEYILHIVCSFQKGATTPACHTSVRSNTGNCHSDSTRLTYSFDWQSTSVDRDNSGFILCLRRLSECYVEENPLHDEHSCVVFVCTDESRLVLVPPQRGLNCEHSHSNHWNGLDNCKKNSIAPTAATSSLFDSTRQSAQRVGVRDVLATDWALSSNSMSRKCNVYGVVMAKQIIFEERTRRQSGNRDNSNLRAMRGLDRKCKLTLRDTRSSDCIVIYLALSCVSLLLVGMTVQFTECVLTLPESRKKPYLRFDSADQKNRIDIVGIAHTADLAHLCSQSGRVFANPRDTAINTQVSLPPGTSIQRLLGHYRHDYCLWTLTGQISLVRRLLVTLRCTLCQNLASNVSGHYKCACCDRTDRLSPLWEAVVAFCDGSGECTLHIEGNDVLRVLRNTSAASGTSSFDKVVQIVEASVRRSGKFVYDAFKVQNRQHSALTADTDIDWSESNTETATSPALSSNWDRDRAVAAEIQTYMRSYSYAALFRLSCRVDHYAAERQHTSDMSTSSSTCRVNVQENNINFPFRALFTAMPSVTQSKLSLEVFSVTELRDEALRLESWKLLQSLENYV